MGRGRGVWLLRNGAYSPFAIHSRQYTIVCCFLFFSFLRSAIIGISEIATIHIRRRKSGQTFLLLFTCVRRRAVVGFRLYYCLSGLLDLCRRNIRSINYEIDVERLKELCRYCVNFFSLRVDCIACIACIAHFMSSTYVANQYTQILQLGNRSRCSNMHNKILPFLLKTQFKKICKYRHQKVLYTSIPIAVLLKILSKSLKICYSDGHYWIGR